MKKKVITILSIIILVAILAILVFFLSKTKADLGTTNHPLPKLSHWTSSFSTEELDLIKRGHHITLALPISSNKDTAILRSLDLETILEAKQLNIPISFPSEQWDQPLLGSPYKDIDVTNGVFTGSSAMTSSNPLLIDKTTNVVSNMLDPFGPASQIDAWRQVGSQWSQSKTLNLIETLYNDPPQINFISNNETNRANWGQMVSSKRYQELFVDTGRENEFKDANGTVINLAGLDNFRRRVNGDGWIDRLGALIESFRGGLSNQNWKDNSIFTAYSSFGPSYFGRWWGWALNGHNAPTTYKAVDLPNHAETVPRINAEPYAYDGSSEEVYLAPYYGLTDYTVMSPQVESMNWAFMLEETRRRKPNYWFELSTWDGHKPQCSPDYTTDTGYCANIAACTLSSCGDRRTWYELRGQTFTPERYAAMVQFTMWISRPNSVREFRFPLQTWKSEEPYFLALTKMVDRVYDQPVLTDFWQNGTLVENTSKKHPYNLIESSVGYTNTSIRNDYGIGRWFMLNTNLDPVLPTNVTALYATELPVYSMALSKGASPDREWLVYAHSPKQDRQGVVITIPGYKDITVDVSATGSFYHVIESGDQIIPIIDEVPRLNYIEITPDEPLIGTGQTQQFTAKFLDQYEKEIAVSSPSWSATGGTIDANGLFTALGVSGEYKITATVGSISNSINIKVGNLAGQWNFNESSGLLVNDNTGRNHHCVFFNPSWGVDGFRKYANFTKGSGGLVSCNNDETIYKPTETTVAAWVKLNLLNNTAGNQYIVSNGEVANPNNFSLVYAYENFNNKSKFIFFVGDGTTTFASRSESLNLEANKWYYVVGTYKPGAFMNLYVNGQKVAGATTNLPSKLGFSQPDFLIGNGFDGQIDQVGVYNQALSPEEISNLYASGNISLQKSIDKTTVKPGDSFKYTITYQNIGDSTFSNVAVQDFVPDNFEIVSAPEGATIAGQLVTWNIGNLAAGSPPRDLVINCRVRN